MSASALCDVRLARGVRLDVFLDFWVGTLRSIFVLRLDQAEHLDIGIAAWGALGRAADAVVQVDDLAPALKLAVLHLADRVIKRARGATRVALRVRLLRASRFLNRIAILPRRAAMIRLALLGQRVAYYVFIESSSTSYELE